MKTIISRIALFWFAISIGAGAAAGQPRIFFSDLESGPNTGGQHNDGAFVTIYGTRFGTTRGASSVMVGAGQPLRI